MCFYIVRDTNIGLIFETAKKTYPHFPEGALRLVCLRGVHLAEVEGYADHDIAPHDVAVHVFHEVGGDASLQGLLLVQDVGDLDRKGHRADFLADACVPEELRLAVTRS